MAKLENPAASLRIEFKDIMDILSDILKERNWKKFDTSNINLTYYPYYIFNYDVLVEQEVRGQQVSQGFSGKTALNAIEADLEPALTEVMDNQPIDFEKEIATDIDYDLKTPAISEDEKKETTKIKLASQFNVSKEDVATSAYRLVYWPIWVIFVKIPGEGIQKLMIDGVAGYPLNVEEVPEREKGWVEVSKDTFEKLKSPKGWGELGKTAAKATAGGMKTAVTKEREESSKTSGAVHWLFHTKTGQYTVILLVLLILLWIFMR